MPQKKAHLRRSGSDTRGAARINLEESLPNTFSDAWAEKFMGKSTTAEALGDISSDENLDPSPQKLPYGVVAAQMKRPLQERKGVGHGRGKHPRTIQQQAMTISRALAAEEEKRLEYRRLADLCKLAISDHEIHIEPQAELLCYSPVHMYIKYQAVWLFFEHRAVGHSAIGASEQGGWPSLTSGSTVRSWANDFVRPYMRDGDKTPKPVETFSIYERGGHVQWLLKDEGLQLKARKWLAKNTEKKGEANCNIKAFSVYLAGKYDKEAKAFVERGLLTDVLEDKGRTGLSMETARLYLHKLGFSYDFTRKNVYADGFDRPDVIKHRNEVFLPAMEEVERRGYYWVPQAWLEDVEHWPSVEPYRAWVDAGKPEVHIDAFEWKNEKTPGGVDRMAEWGPMGGVLSSRLQPGEKPVILIKQDETTIAQYDTQKKAWRHGGTAHSLGQKNEGAKVMYSGYIEEITGGFPFVTEADVVALNVKIAAGMPGSQPEAIKAAQHDIDDLKRRGIITEVDADGKPTISDATRTMASKIASMPSLMQIEIGKNKEGYWDGDNQVVQAKLVQEMMMLKYPGYTIVHVYDWSSGHHGFDDDALVAKKLNAGAGGKQPLMRDTTVLVTECGAKPRNLTPVAGSAPPRLAQRCTFKAGEVVLIEKAERVLAADDTLIGKPKGAMQMARERDVYVKGMSMKGPVLKADEPDPDDPALVGDDDDLDEDDEDKGVRRDLSKSVIHVLSQMSDFKGEKSKLQKAVEAMGGEVIWLSKYHACCNAIEYVWGNRKKAHRITCDFKMDTLRRSGFLCMLDASPTFVQKAFRKARNFMTALRGGSDAFEMFKEVASIKKERYVSHRRPAPSAYE